MPWGSMGSIWAEFGLDYTKFQQGVQQVTRELVTLDGKYQEAAKRMEQTVNAAMERLGATISAASSKQSLLGDSFDGNAAKARALEQALDELLMAGVSPTNQRVQELAKELQSVQGRMEQAAQAAQQMSTGMESVGQRVQALAQQMTQVGSQMSIGLTLPLTALTGFAAKASMDFESAMAKVWTITDMTKGQLDSLGSQLERLSSSIPQSAQQLAAGLYDAIGSGITDVAEAMQVLEVAAKAGQAGATSTAVAMDALTSAINAYGMEASQAGELADVMFRAMDKGKLTFEEIAGNLGQVISTAAVAGVQFEEIAAAFATLTKGGVGAAEAATAVNQAILTIIQPSEQAAAYAEQLGIEFNAAALASKGLSGVLEDVYQATGGNIESMTALFSNVRALKGALGLTRNEMQDYKSDLDSMATASGAAERAFEKQMQTSAAQAQLFRNEIANLGRAFGAELLPMLNSLIERIKPLVQAFTELPDGVKQAAIVFATVTAAIGPLMAAVGGLVTLMSGPAGWIVAITAVGSALYGLVSSIRDVDGQMTRMIQSAQDTISKLKDQAQEYGNNARALNDLLVKYEDLAEKSKTSETAQKELQEVVKRIGEIAPGVVTQWNDVGEAIAINSDKAKEAVREMLEARRNLLEVAEARAKIEKPRLEQIVKDNESRVTAAVEKQTQAYNAMIDAQKKSAQAAELAARAAVKNADIGALRREAFDKGLISQVELDMNAILPWEIDMVWKQKVSAAEKAFSAAAESAKKTSTSFYDAKESLAEMAADAAELAAVLDKLNEGDLWAGLEGKGGKTGKSGAATSGGTGPVPDKTTLTAFQEWTKEIEKLPRDAYGKLREAWDEIAEDLDSDSKAKKTWAEERAGALINAMTKALRQSGGDLKAAANAASLEVKSGFMSLKEKLKAETETDFQAYGRKLAEMPRDVFGGLIDEWARIADEMKSGDPAVAFYAQKRAQALVNAITAALTANKGDRDAAFKAALAEYESGYQSLAEKTKASVTKAQTEFAEMGETIAGLDRETYGRLMDEWASIADDLKSKDPFVLMWAEERSRVLLSVVREGFFKSGGNMNAALKEALAEVDSGYKSILDRFKETSTAATPKMVSDFAAFGKEVAKLSRETHSLIMDEWDEIAKALEEGDSIAKTWATARANLLLSVLRDAITQGSGSLEERWAGAMDAVTAVVEGGYASLKQKLQSGFGDAMREFQHKVVMGDIVGADAQIAELERIKDAHAKTADEIWQIDERLHQLRESKRSQAIRDAYDQFQTDVRLYDLSAKDQAEYLGRLLNDENLKDEERKSLAGELALAQKQAARDVAEYNRQVNDDWNRYYLDSGMKTRAQLLEEEEAAAYARLAEAQRTGKGIEAAEVALAQAQLALHQQDRKDAEEKHRFLVGLGALTLKAQLEQIQTWIATETENSGKWGELKLEEKALLTQIRKEMFEEFRATQDYSQPLSEIFKGQANWLRENVLLAKDLVLSSSERLNTEGQVYDLMLKSFNAAKQEGGWTAAQEKTNLADYLGIYAVNADLKIAHRQRELDVEARAAEEEAKIRDKAFKDALAAAEDALAVTEKNAEKEKAAFNRVMNEKLPVAERTEAAIAAIKQRNAVYDFRIQQEASKRAEEDADRRVTLALKEADAKLDAGTWGIEQYRQELDRLLKDEVSMSTAASDKIEDKRRELRTKEQKETRKATEAGWQSEIDAEVAKWDEKLKLEKNGSEAQAAIAREATKALQAEFDKRLAAETMTEEQKAKFQRAIGDFDFQAKDKGAAAEREAWDREVSDYADSIRRQVETEKSLGYDAAAKNLRAFLSDRLTSKTVTYSKERDIEKLVLDYEAKGRAQARKDDEDLWDNAVSVAIDGSRKRIDIAKAEAKAQGESAEQAYRDEAKNLQKILDERLKSGSITLSAAEKLNQEIAKLNHEAGLAALDASNDAADQAAAAKLREVEAKLSLDKNYAVAILDLQKYLNDETVKLTALGRDRLKTTIGKYETDAKLQAQKASEEQWKAEIDARVSAAQQSAKLDKEKEKSYADALEHEADELKKFLAARKVAGTITLKQEEDLLKQVASMRQDAEIERIRESKSSADKALGDKMAAVKEQLRLDKDYIAARTELEAYAEKHGAEISKGAASTLNAYLVSLDTDATLQHRKNLEEMVKDQIKSIELRMTAEGFGYAKAGELLQTWLDENEEVLAEWADASAVASAKAADWKAKADADARKANEERWKSEIDSQVSAAQHAAQMERERGKSYAKALEDQASALATYLADRKRVQAITDAQEVELLRRISEMKQAAELERLRESNNLSDRAAAAEIKRVNDQLKLDKNYAKAKSDITKYQLDHDAELTQKSRDALANRLSDLDIEETLAHRKALEDQVKNEIEAIERRMSRQGLSYTEATQQLQDWLDENKDSIGQWAGAVEIAFDRMLDWAAKADEATRKGAAGWADTMASIDKKLRTSYDDRIAAIYAAAAALAGKTTNMGEINLIYQAADIDASAVYAEKARDEIALIRILYAQSALEQVRQLTQLQETYVDLGAAGVQAVADIKKAVDSLNLSIEDATALLQLQVDAWQVDPLRVSLDALTAQKAEYAGIVADAALIDEWFAQEAAKVTEAAIKQRIGATERMNEYEVARAEETLEAIRAIVADRVGAESDAMKAVESMAARLVYRRVELEEEAEGKRKSLALGVQEELAQLRGDDEQAFLLSLERRIQGLREAGWSEVQILEWVVAHGEKVRRDRAQSEYDLRKRIGAVAVQDQLKHEQELAEASQQNANARAGAVGRMYETVMGLANEAKLDELKGIRETMKALQLKYEAMGEGWELYALAAEMALEQIDGKIRDKEQGWGKDLADHFLSNLGDVGQAIQTYQSTMASMGEAADPMIALAMVVAEIVTKSRAWAALVDVLNPLIEELAELFGELIAPLVPIIDILVHILTPVIRAVAAVLAWLGDITVAIWSAIAKTINALLGWLGVHVPVPDKDWRKNYGIDDGKGGSAGTQISEITGPTRDLLIELMRPLRVLDSLPVYAASVEKAIYSMREAFLVYAGGQAAANGAAAAVVNNYYSINTIQIFSSGEEDFDQLMQSLGRRAELALLGSGVP